MIDHSDVRIEEDISNASQLPLWVKFSSTVITVQREGSTPLKPSVQKVGLTVTPHQKLLIKRCSSSCFLFLTHLIQLAFYPYQTKTHTVTQTSFLTSLGEYTNMHAATSTTLYIFNVLLPKYRRDMMIFSSMALSTITQVDSGNYLKA